MSGRVLHPTDFSKASGPAFARAVAEARQTRSELLLIHVLAPVIPIGAGGEGYISPSAYDQMEKSARAWAQKQMDGLLPKAKAAAIFILAVQGMETNAEDSRTAFIRLQKEFADTPYAGRADAFLFELDNLQVGKTAPDFEATDEKGVKYKLSDYRGKVTVIDFWGFW